MPTYTYPGVYIEEIAGGPVAISATSPSTGAMIGGAVEGPVNEPTLVTTFREYGDLFGPFTPISRMTTSAFAFFANGGQNLVVVRVVPADADKATTYIAEAVQPESLTADAGTLTANFAAFTGANATAKNPIVPSDPAALPTPIVNVTIVITGGGTANGTLKDDGAGLLVPDVSAVGVSGTIDYDSGEITISGPAGSTLNVASFVIEYLYKTFTFNAKYEGARPNDYELAFAGDRNFYDAATASYSRYTLQVLDTANNDAVLEAFSGLVFTDPTSANFVVTVLNDPATGSGYIAAVAEGNNEGLPVLDGTVQINETLSPVPPYDGVTREFEYTLANPVSLFTFAAEFEFEGAAVTPAVAVVGDTFVVSGAGNTVLTFPLPIDYALFANDVAAGRLLLATARTDLNGTQLVASANPDVAGLGVFANNTFVYNGATDTFAVTAGVLVNANIDGAASGIAVVGGNLVATITLMAGGGNADPEFDPTTVTFAATSSIAATSTYSLGTILLADDGEGAVVDTGTGTAVGLSLETASTAQNTIDYDAGVVTLTWRFTENPGRGPALAAIEQADYYEPASAVVASVTLAGGDDGSALSRSVVSAPALAIDAKGLYALNRVDSVLNVCIPDFEADYLVSGDLIDYCETRKDRFGVVSVPTGLTNNQAVGYKQVTLAKNSSRAAIYYPHIRIMDPVLKTEVLHPAGGHVLGVFARTDAVANVSTAPAGATRGELAFSVGLEFNMTPEQAGITNTANVNNLVQFPTTGRVVWGARTLQVGGEFPYIQMRRLFMFLEKSIFNSTQQFVFENNGAALQARVRLTVESFLLTLFTSGYFSGTSPSQAFFVVCDSSNNPASLVAQGILTCDIGVAPTRPAEFIVFRFQQKALEA